MRRLRFSYDLDKAQSNLRKHGVDFDEARTAFTDAFSVTIPDPDHSMEEVRYLLLGMSRSGRLLVVAHAERRDEIRLISARLATRAERRAYEAGP